MDSLPLSHLGSPKGYLGHSLWSLPLFKPHFYPVTWGKWNPYHKSEFPEGQRWMSFKQRISSEMFLYCFGTILILLFFCLFVFQLELTLSHGIYCFKYNIKSGQHILKNSKILALEGSQRTSGPAFHWMWTFFLQYSWQFQLLFGILLCICLSTNQNTRKFKSTSTSWFFFLLSTVSYSNKLHFRSQKFFHILYEKHLTQCRTDNRHMINESRYHHQDRQHSTAIKSTWFGV